MTEYATGYVENHTDSWTEEDYLSERDRIKRRHRIIGISTLTATLLAGGGATTYYFAVPNAQTNIEAAFDSTETDDRVSELTSMITGTHVRVACDNDLLDRTGGLETVVNGVKYEIQGRVYPLPLGVMDVAVPVTVVHEQVCADLLNPQNLQPETFGWATHYEGPKALARAVVTLLHEREHTYQVFDEAEANCYAYQKLPDALAQLGMSQDFLKLVSDAVTNQAEGGVYPPNYYSEECREGGAYDLGIGGPYLEKISPQQ